MSFTVRASTTGGQTAPDSRTTRSCGAWIWAAQSLSLSERVIVWRIRRRGYRCLPAPKAADACPRPNTAVVLGDECNLALYTPEHRTLFAFKFNGSNASDYDCRRSSVTARRTRSPRRRARCSGHIHRSGGDRLVQSRKVGVDRDAIPSRPPWPGTRQCAQRVNNGARRPPWLTGRAFSIDAFERH
jgi:hypothetical protein